MEGYTNSNANTSNNSIIFNDDNREKVSDSDSTDYEPEPKKSKVDGDDNDEVIGIPIRGATSTIHLAVGSGFQISITATGNNDVVDSQENVLDDLHQSLEYDDTEEQQRSLQDRYVAVAPESPQDRYVAVSPSNSPSARGIRVYDERRGTRRRRINRNNGGATTTTTTTTSQSAVRTSSSSLASSEYYTDDIDLNEIPSDEYLSPPYALRQRRNAIFARREPPSPTQVEEDQYFHNELEVASNADSNENPIEDASSTSGTDYEVFSTRQTTAVPLKDPDLPVETDNNFADNENRSDVDSEAANFPKSSPKPENAPDPDPSKQDKEWLCIQCKANAMPRFNYCGRCFKVRRNWLPPRPASRRLKSRKTRLQNSNSNSLNNSRATRSSSSDNDDVVDGARPCSSSQIQPNLPSSDPIDMNDGFLVDEDNPSVNRLRSDSRPGNVTLLELFSPPAPHNRSTPTLNTNPESNSSKSDSQSQSQSQSTSSSSQSQGSLFSANSQNSQNSLTSINSSPTTQPRQSSSPLPKNTSNDNTNASAALSSQCSICYVRSKDAAFVHNKIAHLYCCYTCADKILKKNGKCPICWERVLRVVKIISV